MKISEFTFSVLKNFTTINSGIVLQPGKHQKTLSPEESILAEVELDMEFPSKFGIYDLNQFLGNISTMNSPELTFHDKYVEMEDDTIKLKFISCDPSLIQTPKKSLDIENPDVTFDLLNSTFSKLLKLAAMNSLSYLSVIGKNGELRLMVHDLENTSSNVVSTKVAEYDGAGFHVNFKVESLKIMPDDYTVYIKEGVFGVFKSKTKNVKYCIGLEIE